MSWLYEHEPHWFANRGETLVRFESDPRNLVLAATVLGSSMAFIDATVVNVALPTIGRDLGLGLAGRQWVFLSYSLVLAGLYLVAGAVSDRLGQRRVFLAGLVAFAVASALAGVSPDGAFLIAVRALQGAGAAFLTTTSLALLRSTFANESSRAVGLWTAWTGIATILGPPVGGALTQWVSWRAIFYLNVPVALGAAALLRAAETTEQPRPHRPLDVVGAVLFAVGIAGLTYALVEGPAHGAAHVAWAIALGTVGLAAALVYESRTREPMLPLELFRRRNFAVANLTTLFVYASLSGSTFFLVLYLQSVVGYSPLQASLTMIPISILMILLAGRFGRLADRRGPRLFLAVGPALLAGGMLCWEFVADRGDWWALLIGVVLFGIGLAVTVAPITATALSAAPASLSGIAAGVNNTVSRIGGLLAVAVLGLVIAVVFSAQSATGRALGKPASPSERSASVDAFRAALGVAAFLALAGGAVAAAGISDAQARSSERG